MKIRFNLLLYITICMIAISLKSCGSQLECEHPEEVTYTKDIAPVIEAKCFMCHAPEVYKKKASRIKIYDYKNLVNMAESGQLMGSITHKQGFIAMPYKKGTKIDTCSIVLINKWIETGMKK